MEYKNGSALSMSAEPFPLHHSFFNYVVVTQHFFDYRPPDNVENGFLQCVERPGKFDFQRGFAVHKLDGAVEKLADIIYAAPYLRYASVHAEQAVYGLAVLTEYSVVKMVSLGVSANWPRNAKFTQPSGITSGRSPFALGMKNAVI